MLAATSEQPRSSTTESIARVAGPVSFFCDVATFQIVPSGACSVPPYPQSDLVTGLITVAPAPTALSNRLFTVLGCPTVSDSVKPRNPLVSAAD
ncbi:hypothetical protein [Kribbella sp. NPDC049584]|uniref:hypothetical protein n=1 Tax=Kribbella sp. NPDC049584 TaxID=3154833 RepID=UPI00341AA0A4